MKPHVSVITLGVRDLNQAKQFYGEGLGWPLEQDYPQWASFGLNDGTAALGLYPWESLAEDAGVPADGTGFRGVTLSYLVRSDDQVDEVLLDAEKAGATIVKPAQAAWGGRFGYFADPDGYLWKVASSTGPQPNAE